MRDPEFTEYYDRMKDTVYRAALSYMKNPADAADIVQEVMIRLYRHEGGFTDDEHCRRWLLRVTVNLAKDMFRSSWFRKREDFDLDRITDMRAEDRNTLDLILQLPLKYRMVIYLHYYEGYSYTEIAEILRISVPAVKMRAKRGRQMLKIDLTEGDR